MTLQIKSLLSSPRSSAVKASERLRTRHHQHTSKLLLHIQVWTITKLLAAYISKPFGSPAGAMTVILLEPGIFTNDPEFRSVYDQSSSIVMSAFAKFGMEKQTSASSKMGALFIFASDRCHQSDTLARGHDPTKSPARERSEAA
jgi:hypothetical protein